MSHAGMQPCAAASLAHAAATERSPHHTCAAARTSLEARLHRPAAPAARGLGRVVLGHRRRLGRRRGLGVRGRAGGRVGGFSRVCIQAHHSVGLACGGVCDARLLERLQALNGACWEGPVEEAGRLG